METPESFKLRRTKLSSKKRREKKVDETKPEPTREDDPPTNNTPPHSVHKTCKIVERKQEEIRGVEWQYYGKFAEADIPVVWGSPQASPVIKPKRSAGDSPVCVPKHKPVTRAPKHFSCEELEEPQFLNEILALAEKIKAEGENRSLNNSGEAEKNNEACPGTDTVMHDSYSDLFDESMNEHLLKCSQEYEEACGNIKPLNEVSNVVEDQENKQVCLETNVLNTSPKKKLPVSGGLKSSNSSSGVFSVKDTVKGGEIKSPRVGNKNYVHVRRKVNTYIFQGRVLGSRKNMASTSNESKPLHSDNDKKRVLQSYNCDNKIERLGKSKTSCALDNSFETFKESLFADDLDLSTIPVDLEIEKAENMACDLKKTPETKQSKMRNSDDLQTVSSAFDDSTYFEEGVLQYLDAVESNVVLTNSQKLRCTPEQIEKKRQEAKLKLEKKKMYKKINSI